MDSWLSCAQLIHESVFCCLAFLAFLPRAGNSNYHFYVLEINWFPLEGKHFKIGIQKSYLAPSHLKILWIGFICHRHTCFIEFWEDLTYYYIRISFKQCNVLVAQSCCLLWQMWQMLGAETNVIVHLQLVSCHIL